MLIYIMLTAIKQVLLHNESLINTNIIHCTNYTEAVPSINYIGRQLDVSNIGREMYGEISIYQMRHLAAKISTPKVRDIHDHFLWREWALYHVMQGHVPELTLGRPISNTEY